MSGMDFSGYREMYDAEHFDGAWDFATTEAQRLAFIQSKSNEFMAANVDFSAYGYEQNAAAPAAMPSAAVPTTDREPVSDLYRELLATAVRSDEAVQAIQDTTFDEGAPAVDYSKPVKIFETKNEEALKGAKGYNDDLVPEEFKDSVVDLVMDNPVRLRNGRYADLASAKNYNADDPIMGYDALVVDQAHQAKIQRFVGIAQSENFNAACADYKATKVFAGASASAEAVLVPAPEPVPAPAPVRAAPQTPRTRERARRAAIFAAAATDRLEKAKAEAEAKAKEDAAAPK